MFLNIYCDFLNYKKKNLLIFAQKLVNLTKLYQQERMNVISKTKRASETAGLKASKDPVIFSINTDLY